MHGKIAARCELSESVFRRGQDIALFAGFVEDKQRHQFVIISHAQAAALAERLGVPTRAAGRLWDPYPAAVLQEMARSDPDKAVREAVRVIVETR